MVTTLLNKSFNSRVSHLSSLDHLLSKLPTQNVHQLGKITLFTHQKNTDQHSMKF